MSGGRCCRVCHDLQPDCSCREGLALGMGIRSKERRLMDRNRCRQYTCCVVRELLLRNGRKHEGAVDIVSPGDTGVSFKICRYTAGAPAEGGGNELWV